MRVIVGTLTRHVDGCLSGVLRTLTIRAQIELRPIGPAAAGPMYEVMLGSGFIVGHGMADGSDIEVTILAPELPTALRLRAVSPPSGAEEWRLVWDTPL